ncbi:MAG TPA: hypothetical protein EYP90_06780 [Chromatiaceae bacterium]|nr:hypothetical protein [Chromatiaceae bacterium]
MRMSEIVETDSQALNHLLTEAAVDWEGLSGEIARQADALLGGERSALILDESAFAKKGSASAGVARQWNGRLGKVDNAQVGVFAALCRSRRVTLLDSRLYLPPGAGRTTRSAVSGPAFPRRPASHAASVRWPWSWWMPRSATRCALVMWWWMGATARIRPFCAPWRRVRCVLSRMSTKVSASG